LFEARRRYFLKNHTPAYAALTDLAMISGLSLWKLRTLLTRKEDYTAPYLLRDSIKHSVFLTGFAVRQVQNPALAREKEQRGVL